MKKILIPIFILFFISAIKAQTLYDINTIQDIKIEFTQSNWDYILDTAAAGKDEYVMAKYVIINGVVFDSVGVKYKGNSTYKPNQAKNPLHIELDTWKNQDYEGYTDIKLSNVAFDPSFIREPLSYTILRQYMDAPQSNYANISINGALMGLYVSSESISKKFVKKYFGNNNNAFFKCNPSGGGMPGGMSRPSLEYLGMDSTKYFKAYELKTDYGWKDLVLLCNTLNNTPAQIESVLDVDRALWMLAFNNLFVNLDSYTGDFRQNYYLYKDDFGRFNPIVWDLNMSFGIFSFAGGSTQLSTTKSKQEMNHLLHINESGWPLIQKLLANPSYKRMYIAHLRTMLQENFSNGSYKTTAQEYHDLVTTSVQQDPKKFFSTQMFQNNLNADVNVGIFIAPGIFDLMDGRANYLSNLADFKAVPPTITDISHSTFISQGSKVHITANVSNANPGTVTFAFRYGTAGPFIKLKMEDDGQHNDGVEGDNIYGAEFDMDASLVQYYIYAENNSAGAFSPERAEHEFYTIYANINVIEKGEVVINELMSNNETTVTDPSGNYSDWIELYNNTDQTLSLKDAYLSDSYTEPLKWKFPDNTTIAPKGYLIVWASDTTQAGLNTNFKLSNNGEQLILSYENGFVTDSITFPSLKKDRSYARCPNGTGAFSKLDPTYSASNCASSTAGGLVLSDFSIYPNPASGRVHFRLTVNNHSDLRIKLTDMSGLTLWQLNGNDINNGLDISQQSPGLYFIELAQLSTGKTSIRKLLKL